MARPLSDEAHRKVLDASRALLFERGLDGFTVDAVAQRSGVAKSTIYRHFPSVHLLLVAALDTIIAPVPTPNTGSLRDDLLELFFHHLPAVDDPRLRAIALGLLNASTTDPDFERVATAMKDQRTEPIRTVVQLAIGRGEIPSAVDVDLAVDLIEGPLFMHLFVRQLPVDHHTVTRLVDLAVAGLTHWPAPQRASSVRR